MDRKPVKEHPVFQEMMGYGLNNDQQIQMAFNVYLDLCEVKGFWNVRCHKCTELGMAFFSGHSSRSEPREIILPVSCDWQLSPAQMQIYTAKVRVDGYHTTGLVLAICSSDSGIVYYKVTDGLVQPESPEESEFKRIIRMNRVETERNHVRKHTAEYIAQINEQTISSNKTDESGGKTESKVSEQMVDSS